MRHSVNTRVSDNMERNVYYKVTPNYNIDFNAIKKFSLCRINYVQEVKCFI